MEKYCEPHQVNTRLTRAFISGLLPDNIVSELNDFGVKTHRLGKSDNMHGELAYHPDILLNNVKKGVWLCENDPKYLPNDIELGLIKESEVELGDLYPYDCPFNNFRLKNMLFCGKSAAHLIISYARYEDMNIVFVPQNYTKCCCVIVNNDAVITSDYYIGRALRRNNYDVLTLDDCPDIGLRGYRHGLIGGCYVKLSKDLIGFTGNLNKYRYGNDIRDFCANYGIDAMSLSNEPLYDYGGILPIAELSDE